MADGKGWINFCRENHSIMWAKIRSITLMTKHCSFFFHIFKVEEENFFCPPSLDVTYYQNYNQCWYFFRWLWRILILEYVEYLCFPETSSIWETTAVKSCKFHWNFIDFHASFWFPQKAVRTQIIRKKR